MQIPKTQTLDYSDVELLYAIPRAGGDLYCILRCFVSINRTAIPAYEQIRATLCKAIALGAIVKESNEFRVNDDWYEKLHKYDESAVNEIESLLEAEDEIVEHEFSSVEYVEFSLPVTEYDQAARALADVLHGR